MDLSCKKYYNRANFVISTADPKLDDSKCKLYYCARNINEKFCGPSFGEQCADCDGYNTSDMPPPFACYNRKGCRMLLDPSSEMYYCGCSVTGFMACFGRKKCHFDSKWQCKDCLSFATNFEPKVVGRAYVFKSELCPAQSLNAKVTHRPAGHHKLHPLNEDDGGFGRRDVRRGLGDGGTGIVTDVAGWDRADPIGLLNDNMHHNDTGDIGCGFTSGGNNDGFMSGDNDLF